jgi:oxygen-independent coproporphyrinogen-3 oxidase
MRYRHPEAYLRGVREGKAVQERREVRAEDLPFEFMMNALRLTAGVPARLFAERTGLPLESIRRPLAEAQRKGLLELTTERIAPTERGRRFLNDLLEVFLP